MGVESAKAQLAVQVWKVQVFALSVLAAVVVMMSMSVLIV